MVLILDIPDLDFNVCQKAVPISNISDLDFNVCEEKAVLILETSDLDSNVCEKAMLILVDIGHFRSRFQICIIYPSQCDRNLGGKVIF